MNLKQDPGSPIAETHARQPWRSCAWVVFGVVLLGVLPPLVFWWEVARVPSMNIHEALAAAGDEAIPTALVDVRTPPEFEARHVEGAVSWPVERILACPSAGEIPKELRKKRLLVLCAIGIRSAPATRKLRELGVDAWNVEGGTQTWLAALSPAPPGKEPAQEKLGSRGVTFREATAFEQFFAVQSGFAIKPIYMLAALVLAWVLRRQHVADLVALRRAMAFFFIGEAFCYVNFFTYANLSHLTEYLHSYGMVLAAGFGTFALLEGLDRRLVRFSASNERCGAAALCRPCAKHTPAPCAFKRLFHFLIPACMFLALLPLSTEPVAVCYDTRIWGTLYSYTHPLIYQFYEVRICPLFAMILLGLSWLVLLLKREDPVSWAKVWFSAAMGFLVFSIFRLMIFAPFRDALVWFEFWEEVTEFLGVATAVVMLWVFRKGLWPERQERGESGGERGGVGPSLSPDR